MPETAKSNHHTQMHETVNTIKQIVREYHENCGHKNLSVGDPVFNSEECTSASVPVTYTWKLNAWDKKVDTNDILVRDGAGNWHLFGLGVSKLSKT